MRMSISNEKLPFLDLILRPTSDRHTTNLHYKLTDIHSYLNYTSTHPIRFVVRILSFTVSFCVYVAPAPTMKTSMQRARKWLISLETIVIHKTLLTELALLF